MKFKILQSLNEDHEKRMSKDEMVSYLKLLHKKCSEGTKEKFKEYLKKQCDVEDGDFTKCSEVMCADADKCDKIIHHLEDLSEKLDENSLKFILDKGSKDEDAA